MSTRAAPLPQHPSSWPLQLLPISFPNRLNHIVVNERDEKFFFINDNQINCIFIAQW